MTLKEQISSYLITIAENVQKVFNSGKKAEYDAFWDVYQNKGKMRNNYFAFAYGRFSDANYDPKYPINCSTAAYAAQQLFTSTTGITDTKVPIIVNGTNMGAMCNGASNLVTIREIQLVKANATSTSAFTGCSSLVNITFSGMPIDTNIAFADSPLLSDASIDNIIGQLKDLTGATSKTITFNSTVYDKMVASGKDALVTAKNWILAKA